jgi:DNA-dependent RNA polymerase auxiliary subunit epsilon
MGYTTEFFGKFSTDKEVDEKTYALLVGLSKTRRMKRRVEEKYGIEGEFFIDGEEDTIVDYNKPPSSQPSLWCQWSIQPDHKTVVWDEVEKFYYYVEWLEYIITKILEPRGYKLNGGVNWRGEEDYDFGSIVVENNVIKVDRYHFIPMSN